MPKTFMDEDTETLVRRICCDPTMKIPEPVLVDYDIERWAWDHAKGGTFPLTMLIDILRRHELLPRPPHREDATAPTTTAVQEPSDEEPRDEPTATADADEKVENGAMGDPIKTLDQLQTGQRVLAKFKGAYHEGVYCGTGEFGRGQVEIAGTIRHIPPGNICLTRAVPV